MQLASVSDKRLYQQIAEQLSEMIHTGQIAVGERLPSERDLAGRFDVSRPTIREALIALEVSDLVEIRSGSGVYVRDHPDVHSLRSALNEPGPFEILEARMVVEGETAALAAQRISQQELHQLRSLLKQMTELAGANAQRSESVDEQFHLVIAEASRNSALSTTVQWLWGLRNRSETSAAFHAKLRERGSEPIVADHQAIFDALQRKQSAQAREAMQQHLRRVMDEFSDYSLN
jgi:DNA-binding FadR family transcriptional regulator